MGTLVFQATLGGAINLIGPNTASTVNFTLPSADGSSGQALSTNGSGVLSFGTLAVGAGGTGQTSYTNGQLLIGNTTGNTLTKATLTAGSGVTITNGSGAITIAATGAASQWTTTGSDIYYNTGNVAVGSAPKTYSLGKALEVGFAGNGINGASQTQVSLIGNAYYNGAWKYGGTGKAAFMQIDAGVILWYNTDTSGTADNNITGFTERARIPTTGGFQSKTTISVGDATPSTSGAGITFPATQSASSDANTLDDYEEGTWTPTATNVTITSVQGTYTKIGRYVYITFYGVWPSTANGNAVLIQGLPFTSKTIAAGTGGGSIAYNGSNTDFYLTVGTNTTDISTYQKLGTQPTNANLSTKDLTFSISYLV